MAMISPAEYETRIAALERLNSQLAARVNRQARVVEVALNLWRYGNSRVEEFASTCDTYEQQMAQLGKGTEPMGVVTGD
jgi:uncharacterized protein (DUF2384 family)